MTRISPGGSHRQACFAVRGESLRQARVLGRNLRQVPWGNAVPSISPGRDHRQVPPLARGWSSSNHPKDKRSLPFQGRGALGGAQAWRSGTRPRLCGTW